MSQKKGRKGARASRQQNRVVGKGDQRRPSPVMVPSSVGSASPTSPESNKHITGGARRSARNWLLVIFSLIAAFGFAYLGFWSFQPSPASVTASFESLDELEVRFPPPKSSVVSPATPRNVDQNSDGLRGIGFFGQRLLVHGNTKIDLVSPPTEGDPLSPGFALSVTVIRFKAKNFWYGGGDFGIDPGFSVDDIRMPNFHHKNLIEKISYSKVFKMEFKPTGRGADIFQFGSTPYAVLYPMSAVTTTLKYPKDYMDITMAQRDNSNRSEAHSFLDLVGKPYLIWLESGSTVFINGKHRFEASTVTSDGGLGENIALLIESPYVLRLLLQGEASEIGKVVSVFAKNIVDVAVPIKKAKKYFESKRGFAILKGEWPNVIKKDEIHPGSPDIKRVVAGTDLISFEHPWLSEGWGFAIFGSVDGLSLKGVTGSMMVDTTERRFGAPTDVSFRNIEHLSPRGNSLLVMPKQITPFELVAAEIRIRGEVAYRNVHKHTEAIVVAGILLAILGLIAPILATIYSHGRKAVAIHRA